MRLCIDFRKLNSQTIQDAYALPNLEEVFSVLTGSKWFSVLNLKSRYYQIEMVEADKQKTAFRMTPWVLGVQPYTARDYQCAEHIYGALYG